MLAKLIEFIGLSELIISTNQPFNPINHQSLTFVLWVQGSGFRGSGFKVPGAGIWYLVSDFWLLTSDI